ncbi:hypothetical protein [Crossiella cryophila]|uniref:Putative phage tail protein n=1 Tax=Crossiella cryophila TaxID=43355 RepID=A0A7W7CCK1_9PSEU|nr:hypothetical protein [Crossiella cryophila]MBB4678615.1 putative phage tail protein [Crossiella cryophila]
MTVKWDLPEMDWDTWSKILVGVFGAIAAGLKLWEMHRARSARLNELKTMLEIAGSLPADSAAKMLVTRHVEASLTSFVSEEQTKRRDPTGIVLGVAFIGGGSWLAYTALTSSGWWWFLAAPVLAIGLAGFTQDVTRRERDARGRPVRIRPDRKKK